MMTSGKVPQELHHVLARLRCEAETSRNLDDLFGLVLELVEYVASREDLVRARERELEPDALARRIFADPETLGIRAIDSLLAKLTRRDLAKLERILLRLEQRHGKALETPPNYRLLVDGAVLGQVGFVYNRKFREILATRSLKADSQASGLLPDLLSRVDALFADGRPRYLWRLGPEFGVDRNVRHLLDRGDDFIVRSLYRSRARRLAGGVLRWQELPGGDLIGENCDDLRYSKLVRSLVVRSSPGGSTDYSLLVTNLLNTPWEDVYRLHRNRSGKLASRVVIGPRKGGLRQMLTASVVIMALLTFRNVRTWASEPSVHRDVITVQAEPESKVGIYETRRQAELLDRMREVAEYVQALTGGGSRLGGLEASPRVPGYSIRLPHGSEVPAFGPGQVMYVDPEGEGELGKSVVIYHGFGISSVYGHLATVSEDLRLGGPVSRDQAVGLSNGESPPLHLEARLARSYAERGAEPAVADILSSGANLLLDPVAAVVEAESRRGREAADEAPTMPSFDRADLFLLEDPDLPVGVLFLAAGIDRAEPLIIDPDEPLLAQFLGEDLEDLS